ncbi:MAG: response regulator [Burkholderiaceae bacterium]|nr:response regulator [Burkholderiaceae bacterium]
MSIRARLLTIALLATLLPALMAVARLLHERDAALAEQTRSMQALAEAQALHLVDRIQGTAQLLYGLSRVPVLATTDRRGCSDFMAEVLEAHPQYTGLITIHADGTLFCDSLRSGRELQLSDRAYFRKAMSQAGTVALEPVFGRITGQAVLQIAYQAGATDAAAEGGRPFVLLASLNLQRQLDQSRMRTPRPVPGVRLLLLDARGTLLAGTPADAAGFKPGSSLASQPLWQFAGQAGPQHSVELADPQGQVMRWTRADPALTADAGLLVLVGAPRDGLVADADRRFAAVMLQLALVAALLFAALWAVAELALRRPIQRITGMARSMAAGDLTARLEPPLPRGELGQLMQVLNQTAQALEQHRQDIAGLDARLRQSQRMQAIGQLTGGVAHDFNNLLTVVLGNAELLSEQLAAQQAPHAQQALAEAVVAAAERGAELTRQLLAFARKQALAPRPTEVNALVDGLHPMLQRTLGAPVQIEWLPGAGLWPAMVDPGQLENAVLNLCLNARDAMPGGGRLTLETANARLDAAYVGRHADLQPGDYVMLAVSDTGSGIAAEHLEQVFEPFFTTKEKGKGTGLGLAMVYGFVKQSAGHVALYSEPGHGTTVKLFLPRAAQPADAPAAEVLQPLQAGHGQVVLVVEDDAAVRRLAVNELRSLGYRVIEADSGPAALQRLQPGDGMLVPALLFTDVVMHGGMTGPELAEAALRLRPGLRVLFTSGYTDNAIAHHGRLDPGVRLLAKPYRRAELARAVGDALAEPIAAETPAAHAPSAPGSHS